MTGTKTQGKPNRLIHEKSPYLLQHADNPVDWYPWGEEAFKAAKSQDKPIFLSIGYSTCHWCHVMAHESFENPDIAGIMNKYFISIKVDREERPDLDAIYMTAVQIMTGGGGWPMSVWLTPDLKPFFGGTYFPPDNRYGRPGFPSVLESLARSWKEEKEKILEQSKNLTKRIFNVSENGLAKSDSELNVKSSMNLAYEQLSAGYDKKYGGFGHKPKFPMPVNMEFLLTHYFREKKVEAKDMVQTTLEKIGKCGITDQLGGGFARYSTDEIWLQPHFEKMLYDNAQLISLTVSLYQITKDVFFSTLVHQAITYVLRDLTHPEGAFYSAEDADSEGKEGLFYLWTLKEIKINLGDEVADVFNYRYGVTAEGNFEDPHSDEKGKNILFLAHTVEETRKKFRKSDTEIKKLLNSAEKRLFDIRSKRIRPHLDDKILTGWNGLMISALSKAGAVLNEESYLEAAEKSAGFIEKNLFDSGKKTLYRRWRDGEKKIPAHQIDYALLIQGLLDHFEATGDPHWLRWAADLHQKHNELFYDKKEGGYYMTIPQDDLLIRLKDDRDNVIPSGNSVAALNGFRLGSLMGRKDFEEAARKTLRVFSQIMERQPTAVPKMLTALDFDAQGHFQVVVLGPEGRKDTLELRRAVQSVFLPSKVVLLVDPEKSQAELAKMIPFIQPMSLLKGRATAYVCKNYTCKKPTADPKEAVRQLETIGQ